MFEWIWPWGIFTSTRNNLHAGLPDCRRSFLERRSRVGYVGSDDVGGTK